MPEATNVVELVKLPSLEPIVALDLFLQLKMERFHRIDHAIDRFRGEPLLLQPLPIQREAGVLFREPVDGLCVFLLVVDHGLPLRAGSRSPSANRRAAIDGMPQETRVRVRAVVGDDVGAAAVYAGPVLVFLVLQRSFISMPTPATRAHDGAAVRDVPGARIRISGRPLDAPRAVLYSGGNAADVAFTVPDLAAAFPDRAIYAVHYRGYSGSTGRTTEKALRDDARRAFRMVHERHPDEIVVGRSLGSSLAIQLAAEEPVTRLVLSTPFESILAIARRVAPFPADGFAAGRSVRILAVRPAGDLSDARARRLPRRARAAGGHGPAARGIPAGCDAPPRDRRCRSQLALRNPRFWPAVVAGR